ncbi:hypothetical protein [Paractinoplanes rishiriensis]|uniref:hypothetical protein n=1 Tax=Paractinoplanes rishiriensis TaxID=1050105 RepID=UPI0019440BDB|nr:hypothetical protein [Actinoplanes rishiriensis]
MNPTTTAEAMLAAIWQLCDAHAKGEVNRVLAGHAATDNEAQHLVAQAEYWEQAVQAGYQALAATVREALPDGAHPEAFLPVRPTTGGHIEVHARDTTARPLVIAFTAAQALTIGTHLTALGAVALDRVGAKVDAALPAITEAAPFTSTSTRPGPPPVIPGPTDPR